ncbi:hypothetical protein Prudu_014935 [Prunus dulcis]|uniref:Uncharacterized protein n=1 Tax=Prunus dulcis TaxID=3755 RepID=A0A4Y1RJM7_PRUDU|nr:hypothetical protein Prudu_014935 [Prunus dulcis]
MPSDTRPYSVHRDYFRIMGSQDPVLVADKANVTEASVRGNDEKDAGYIRYVVEPINVVLMW